MTSSEIAEPIDVLRGICHAFGSASDSAEVARFTVRWTKAAIGQGPCSCRLILPDRFGRLRVSAAWGKHSEKGRRRSARRRAVFESKAPYTIRLRGPEARTLALLPLVSRGESFGVLEVIGPHEALGGRWDLLEAVAGQAAMALRNLRQRTDLELQVGAMAAAAALARDLVKASSPEAAVRAAADFCSQRFDFPVAAWLRHGDSKALLAVRGLGRRKRSELRSQAGSFPSGEAGVSEAAARFCDVVGVHEVAIIGAGAAVLLLGGAPASLQASLDVVGSLLADVLDHLRVVAWAERQSRSLDTGLAWTAHEVRGPLTGVGAAIDRLMHSEREPAESRELLQRSHRELSRLVEHVDSLLQLSLGAGSLRRRPTELVRLVDEAVESCGLETGEDRISLSAPRAITVRADPGHLRSAIANVLRNAVTYAPPKTEIAVTVEDADDFVTVSVRDRGPGVRAEDRESIFDPFARGPAARRGGAGLGLFITRRVVEAHDGAVWVESKGKGSTFRIRLPANGEKLPANGERKASSRS